MSESHGEVATLGRVLARYNVSLSVHGMGRQGGSTAVTVDVAIGRWAERCGSAALAEKRLTMCTKIIALARGSSGYPPVHE
jgi:hypothetical protein